MSNLIITIFSIALVGVLAIMAVWYGGPVFMNANAQANANSMINLASQISRAWTLYATERGGSYTITNDANWFNNNLVPAYLQSKVSLSFASGNNGNPKPVLKSATGNQNAATNSNTIQFDRVPQDVCAYINLASQGNSSIPSESTAVFAKAYNGICFLGGDTYYYFIYRVF